jgi:hypothetical protein
MTGRATAGLALALGVVIAHASSQAPAAAGVDVGAPQRISLTSPIGPPCTDADPNFASGHVVETDIAISPSDPRRVLVSWIQDGSATDAVMASRDGARTFSRVLIPGLSACTGGAAQAASDPGVAFSADGRTSYFSGVGVDVLSTEPFRPSVTMLASRSGDGGFSWANPVAVQPGEGMYWDKPILSTDPRRPRVAYYAFALRRPPAYNSGYSLLSRTSNAGRTWSRPQKLYDPHTTSSWPGNSEILVNRDGALVNVFVLASGDGGTGPAQILAARSVGRGARWRRPVVIGRTSGFPPSDPVSQNIVETIGAIPSQTVAPDGDLYVAWAAPGPTRRRSRVVVARSTTGGRSWRSSAVRVRGQSLFPAIAVSGDGTVGVLHYVLAAASHGGVWPARIKLDTTRRFGGRWHTHRVAGPFNMLTAVDRVRGCCAIGDYVNMAPLPHGLIAAYPMAKPLSRHQTDVYVSRITTR